MSLEMHVFLSRNRVPDRSSWQATIDSLGMPLELDATLDSFNDKGFSPSKIKGVDSGFEIYSEPADEILASYPDLTKKVIGRDWCISFRRGGDLKECACVSAASAALVKGYDAVAYYPNDDMIYDLNQLWDDLKACLAEVTEPQISR